MTRAMLFDLDGVLLNPQELFSEIYAKSRGYDLAPFTKFFQTEWNEFVTGKRDLKEHIENNPDLWKWDKSPEELLQFWFECQNNKNDLLIREIKRIRESGVLCYIATEQEKYRTSYVKNKAFKYDFDGVFSTSEIGCKKNDVRFYQYIADYLSLEPNRIIFFDDSQSKVDTAKSFGIDAYIFKNVDQVREVFIGT
jgi:putative hydrolase of the HAD superfamily